jgi:hypothetical protein
MMAISHNSSEPCTTPADADQSNYLQHHAHRPIGAIAFLRRHGLSFDQIADGCRMTLDGKPIFGVQLRSWYEAQIAR